MRFLEGRSLWQGGGGVGGGGVDGEVIPISGAGCNRFSRLQLRILGAGE